MESNRIENAVTRIEGALTRIARCADSLPGDMESLPSLVEQHERLRDEVASTLRELDGLIGRISE